MDQKVRQFHAADGAKFIEHVPGHCLVFIPNNTSIDFLLRELRKVKQPKQRAKPKEKSGKPTNAFIKYRNHKIAEFKANNPEISQTEISRMAGEWWKNESDEVKMFYTHQYREEKRIYDMNKAKRARTESEAGSDTETTSSSPGLGMLHSQTSGSQINPMNYGFGMGLDGGQLGFNPGRRRSQTMPSGAFSSSGAKRRISQEMRKHLAYKSGNAYMAASAESDLLADNSGLSLPQYPPQHAFDFTFTQPIDTSTAPHGGASTHAYVASSMSPLTMPLNPSFPLAEFSISGSMAAPSHIAHHSRTLSNMSTPMSVDYNAYSSSGEGFEAFVPTSNSVSRPTYNASIPSSLPLLDTANLNAFGDGMPMTTFGATGYMGVDTPQMAPASAPWPLTQPYTMLSDAASVSSGSTLNQNQQI
ncbi:hypothetical protein GGH19_002687 [Coemansia sp. RSA 1807]|nr:hypothetical protein LPJ67_003009 [Coemansia sp. RSA 1938]KAJ2133535.1 hypothetical protein GGF48_000038 [Coemansia sp. RSA 921]KAJ2256595.1 hypothetical protein GGH98_001410 [Coemansia sp. RSA 454]KAJ2281765.1 hypothetical protein EV176_000251 [Coemansia sp. RSA 451]KAJ2445359.1 hypothetical protein IWW46_001530 [Coemansia sp. RSA 2440]KAJ2534137.1 hypothetical protein GGH20_000176 [Coemansia sp. RSA 1937]KAJ2575812.1 hypothetical protein GGH19_002687 [Coemansia sp. RSA 1807]KAJ2651599.1